MHLLLLIFNELSGLVRGDSRNCPLCINFIDCFDNSWASTVIASIHVVYLDHYWPYHHFALLRTLHFPRIVARLIINKRLYVSVGTKRFSTGYIYCDEIGWHSTSKTTCCVLVVGHITSCDLFVWIVAATENDMYITILYTKYHLWCCVVSKISIMIEYYYLSIVLDDTDSVNMKRTRNICSWNVLIHEIQNKNGDSSIHKTLFQNYFCFMAQMNDFAELEKMKKINCWLAIDYVIVCKIKILCVQIRYQCIFFFFFFFFLTL